jgi:hypothetical protein
MIDSGMRLKDWDDKWERITNQWDPDTYDEGSARTTLAQELLRPAFTHNTDYHSYYCFLLWELGHGGRDELL